MTPIEIIEAFNRGDKREYSYDDTLNKYYDVSLVGVTIVVKGKTTYTNYNKSDIPWIRIKRETFGFFKAINLMREGKYIRKESTLNRLYRIYNGSLQYLLCGPVDNDDLWMPLYGFPLDWPDSTDFYEEEE